LKEILEYFELAYSYRVVKEEQEEEESTLGSENNRNKNSTYWFFPTFLKSIEEPSMESFQNIREDCLNLPDHSSSTNLDDGTTLVRNSNHIFSRIYEFHTEIPNGFFIRLIYRICSELRGLEQTLFWKEAIFLSKEGGRRKVWIQMKEESDLSSKSQLTTNEIPHRTFTTLELISIGKRSSLVLNQICNQIIDRLIMEWYPGLVFEVKVLCRCPPCEKAFLSGEKPVFWNMNTLLQMKDKELLCVTCFGPPSSSVHITGKIAFSIRIDDLLGEEELVIAKEFLLQPSDIKYDKVPIGTGAFGIVYKGEWNQANKTSNEIVAIKKPHPNAKEKLDIQSWKEEAYMLRLERFFYFETISFIS